MPEDGEIPAANGEIATLSGGFLAYCQLELGLSANTLAAYRSDLLKIGEALTALELTITAVGPDEVARILGWLRDERANRPTAVMVSSNAVSASPIFSRSLR